MFARCNSQASARTGARPETELGLGRRILVVEDDLLIRRLNTEMLVFSGYAVDAAEDGAAAWNALQLNRYDLMVTDNEMPNVSGVELLKKVHAIRLALPVIMATAKIPLAEFTRHPWLQPAVTLLKPYTFDELVGAVQVVLLATVGAGVEIARRVLRPVV